MDRVELGRGRPTSKGTRFERPNLRDQSEASAFGDQNVRGRQVCHSGDPLLNQRREVDLLDRASHCSMPLSDSASDLSTRGNVVTSLDKVARQRSVREEIIGNSLLRT